MSGAGGRRWAYTFRDGEEIFFAEGKFDHWCVYRQPRDEKARPPRDADYFTELLRFGDKYGHERVYSYFEAVYDLTTAEVQWRVFRLIGEQGLSLEPDDYLPYAKVMVTLYYAMVAEENREPAWHYPLKKKVKKIGVFQVLIKRMLPTEAADFSRRKPAAELRRLLAGYERMDKGDGKHH